ncbi:hypothetical protein FRB99_008596 [Tulasnella sp. 403]|nr:hypothetical protein FRB99_008596 [Tulasnella sp. 403]
MREILSEPLTQFEALTQQLFLSLAPPSSLRAPPAPSIDAFLQCDAALATALVQARDHQIKQRRIEQLKEDLLNLEWQLKTVCRKLMTDKTELEAIIRDGEERVKAIDLAQQAAIPADYILAYAHNLTSWTAAPLTNTDPHPDQPAPPAFRPPYPDDSMLRRGFLGSRGQMLTEPTGETRQVGEPAGSPIGPARAPPPPADVPREKRHPGHYRPPPVPDFELDLNPDV